MSRAFDPAKIVKESAKLTERFGGWPSFHDSEVVELRLARSGRDEFEGPILFLVVHLFKGTRDTSSPSGVRWSDHTLATLRFSHVRALELGGFNEQNALNELRIEPAGVLPGTAIDGYRVALEPGHGVTARFLCGAIEVDSAESRLPPYSVYAERD